MIVGVNHEKKNFFGINFDLLGKCIFKKGRHGRLNPQNIKKNGPVLFEKIVF